jgi:transposase
MMATPFAKTCCGILPIIPPKANRREPAACDFRRNRNRNRNQVERLFNRLKQSRRIATRYDKTAASFLGFLCLVSAKLWLTHYVNTA